MAQTNLNILIDEELKEQFNDFCVAVGMDISTAISLFLKKTINENRIPFEISGHKPNLETLIAMAEVEEMKKSNNRKLYDNLDDLFEDLNNEI